MTSAIALPKPTRSVVPSNPESSGLAREKGRLMSWNRMRLLNGDGIEGEYGVGEELVALFERLWRRRKVSEGVLPIVLAALSSEVIKVERGEVDAEASKVSSIVVPSATPTDAFMEGSTRRLELAPSLTDHTSQAVAPLPSPAALRDFSSFVACRRRTPTTVLPRTSHPPLSSDATVTMDRRRKSIEMDIFDSLAASLEVPKRGISPFKDSFDGVEDTEAGGRKVLTKTRVGRLPDEALLFGD